MWVFKVPVRLLATHRKFFLLKLFYGYFNMNRCIFLRASRKKSKFPGTEPFWHKFSWNNRGKSTDEQVAFVCPKVFRGPELDSRKMSYIKFCREFSFLSFDTNRAQRFRFLRLGKNGSGFGSGNYHWNRWINSRNGLPISSYQFYFTCF